MATARAEIEELESLRRQVAELKAGETRSRRTEGALLDAGALQRAIFNSANFSSIATDAKGVIQIFNVGAERMLGYAAAEVMNKVTPADLSDPQELIARAQALSVEFSTPISPGFEALVYKASRGIEDIYELTKIRKDGSRFPAVVSVTALRDAREAIIGYLLIGSDNTARKEAEKKVGRLNQDLLRKNAELEVANKELESFSYSVSHDLRAPLRTIDGFTVALNEDYADKFDEEGRDYFRRIRDAARKMGQLIDDMLKLARITRLELVHEKVDLSQLARTVARELQEAAPERAVEFIVQPGLVAEGDQRLLKIAFENLLSNAWKFTSRHPSARIEFGTVEKDGRTAYFVKDDGAGFDMAYADKLFTTFQRLHAFEEFPGTGIGLPIVQRAIHRHGGRVWGEGAVEKGATFFFTL